MQRLSTPSNESWLMHLPQVVATATTLAASTNYFMFRAPARMRVFAAQLNVRTAISGSSTTPGRFEFRLGRVVNDNTPLSDATFATQTLTLTGNAVADETVTVGATTYTWKSSVSTTANQVKVGSDAADSILNLVAAINGAAGGGTLYGSLTTANASASAVDGAGNTVVLTALSPGTAGNSIASTETMTNASFGAATFAGATADGASGSRLTVGRQITIAPGKYGSDDVEQTEQGFLLEKNQAVWVRCTSIGSTGSPAGLDAALTVGWASE